MAGKRYNDGGRRFKDGQPKRKSKKKLAIVLVSLLAACTVAVSGTVAFLTTSTGSVINSFSPVDTTISIPEELDETNNIKESASVQNNGDIDVYVRAKIVVTWKEATASTSGGSDDVLAVTPVYGTDYTYTLNAVDWIAGNDGYYYYKTSVAPTKSTNPLLTDGKVLTTAPADGYVLSIEIIASAIQVQPDTAVDVWDSTIVNVTGNNGTLTVTAK